MGNPSWRIVPTISNRHYGILVKKHIDEMMEAGLESKKLNIKHMRKPCYRMPVTSVYRGKGPAYTFFGQTGLDILILINITVGIIINKFK